MLGKLPQPAFHGVLAALDEHRRRLVPKLVRLVAMAIQMDLILAVIHPVPLPGRRQPRVKGTQHQGTRHEQHHHGEHPQGQAREQDLGPLEQRPPRLGPARQPLLLLPLAPLS
jgi:hypothetical protein